MGSTFGGTYEDPGGGFFEFAVKRALKQDHMEGKLQVILYFSREWLGTAEPDIRVIASNCIDWISLTAKQFFKYLLHAILFVLFHQAHFITEISLKHGR